jgi:putative hydrolase of the HAD superfamily
LKFNAPVRRKRRRRSTDDASPGNTGALRRHVFFFDLDNTLHDASHAILGTIERRMTDYVVRHLELDEAEADQLRVTYWRRYGATLLGLMRHHAVDPHHFLRATHDFDLSQMVRAERGLARLFARLPGRKVLLTNAPDLYARRVVRELALHRQLGAQYSIEHMRVHGVLRPKPSAAMLRHMLAREGLAGRGNAGRAVLVEDSVVNLKAARASGFRTVLVTRHRAAGTRGGAAYVDLRLSSVQQLPRAVRRMR